MAELAYAQLFDAEVFCMRSLLVCMMVGWMVCGVIEWRGRLGDPRVGFVLWPGHFAIVMLGTPTRGTSLTVI